MFIGFYVVSELYVVEGEINGWAMREMRDDHRICKQTLLRDRDYTVKGNNLASLDVREGLSDP